MKEYDHTEIDLAEACGIRTTDFDQFDQVLNMLAQENMGPSSMYIQRAEELLTKDKTTEKLLKVIRLLLVRDMYAHIAEEGCTGECDACWGHDDTDDAGHTQIIRTSLEGDELPPDIKAILDNAAEAARSKGITSGMINVNDIPIGDRAKMDEFIKSIIMKRGMHLDDDDELQETH